MSGHVGRERVLRLMKARGLRITTPRTLILDELDRSSQYVSAEEIYDGLHLRHPKIGLATVYRTLTLLTHSGIVTKFEFGDGKARYELVDEDRTRKHHHVLVCESCYKVIRYSDFSARERANFDQLETLLEKRFDFSIRRHVVHYYGVCAACRE